MYRIRKITGLRNLTVFGSGYNDCNLNTIGVFVVYVYEMIFFYKRSPIVFLW